MTKINELSQEVEDLKEQRQKEHENTDPNPHALTDKEQYLKGLSNELNEKFTFILGAVHKAARLPKRSMKKIRRKWDAKENRSQSQRRMTFPRTRNRLIFLTYCQDLTLRWKTTISD